MKNGGGTTTNKIKLLERQVAIVWRKIGSH
jgi:hypothetical protein